MFTRKGAAQTQIPVGCRLSTHNSEPMLSSGVPALDDIIGGGGVPLHTATLIKSDRFTGYAHLLLKYFISQGISSNQPIILISLDEPPLEIIRTLPEVVVSSKDDDGGEVDSNAHLFTRATGRVLGETREDKMRIAWRYNNLPKSSTTLGTAPTPTKESVPYCCTFDITKQRVLPDTLHPGTLECLTTTNLDVLYTQIHTLLTQSNSLTKKTHVARIVIHNFGSLNWTPTSARPLLTFINKLTRLVRNSSSVLFMTVPAYAFNDYAFQSTINTHTHSNRIIDMHPFIHHLSHLCTTVLELESFAGTPRQHPTAYTSSIPGRSAYHGLLHILKLGGVKSFLGVFARGGVSKGLVFRVRRKRFLVEVFCLPPDEEEVKDESESGKEKGKELDLNEDVRRDMSRLVVGRKSGMGCDTMGVDPLEF